MFNKRNPHFLSNIGIAFLTVFVICGLFWKLSNPDDNVDNNQTTNKQTDNNRRNKHKSSSRPKSNMLVHKINKGQVRSASDGNYYVDRSDKSIRYFVTDGKITAIKYIMNPANNTAMVQAGLSNLLHDDNLKYCSFKKDESDIILNPKYQYNVWSPKNKKWYNVAMQYNGEKYKGAPLVSQFSVWQGKNPDAL